MVMAWREHRLALFLNSVSLYTLPFFCVSQIYYLSSNSLPSHLSLPWQQELSLRSSSVNVSRTMGGDKTFGQNTFRFARALLTLVLRVYLLHSCSFSGMLGSSTRAHGVSVAWQTGWLEDRGRDWMGWGQDVLLLDFPFFQFCSPSLALHPLPTPPQAAAPPFSPPCLFCTHRQQTPVLPHIPPACRHFPLLAGDILILLLSSLTSCACSAHCYHLSSIAFLPSLLLDRTFQHETLLLH